MASTDDSEAQKLLTDAEAVESLLQSNGWGFIKRKLDERILDLQNINNLEDEKPETLGTQVMARKMASDLLYAWLKQDVVGFVEQQRVNRASRPPRDSDIIDRVLDDIT